MVDLVGLVGPLGLVGLVGLLILIDWVGSGGLVGHMSLGSFWGGDRGALWVRWVLLVF